MIRSKRFIATMILARCVVSSRGLAQQDTFQPEISRDVVAQVENARELDRQKRSPEAAAILKAVTQAHPDYYRAQFNLGIVLAENKDFAGASRAFDAAVALKESKGIPDATVYNSAGWAYLLAGDYKKAEIALKKAEAAGDQLPVESRKRLYNNLGLLYLYTGDHGKSETYMKKASDELGSKLATENLKLLSTVKAARAQSKM